MSNTNSPPTPLSVLVYIRIDYDEDTVGVIVIRTQFPIDSKFPRYRIQDTILWCQVIENFQFQSRSIYSFECRRRMRLRSLQLELVEFIVCFCTLKQKNPSNVNLLYLGEIMVHSIKAIINVQ